MRRNLVLKITYEGDSENVIYPFAIYLVIDIFKYSEKEKIKHNLNIFYDDNYEFDEDDDIDIKPLLEEEALSEITNRLIGLIDSMEGSTAETLQGMMSKGWDIKTIYKGNQSHYILITDEEIIK
ncbi:hypothetical protein [Anabaena cylindrica]|uniref:hypothetical protein n=1 Tax=Anabaena cylindrica TaxID=1165 RepID=UPI0012373A88|nr:hypothetical protein [Anabaena cylindrica]MBY5310052.1 hypothetical protein [Anabaena sp. CCAP 1446/1C]MCM2405271.1 hypothetical protein [Anabaena sp. CCAP 1446/1C]